MDIHAIIRSLSNKRRIFHSEADFQFAFAWEIKCLYPDCDIRLEVPFNMPDRKGRIDVVVRYGGGFYPIELKYLKKTLQYSFGSESFTLAAGANDMDMYSCIGDIDRMESLCSHFNGFRVGYAIWLSNNPAYWDSDYNASYYKEFHAPDNSIKTGKMYYDALNPRTGRPPQILTEREYSKPIVLNGCYHIKWHDYSDLGIRNGLFRYTVVCVTN